MKKISLFLFALLMIAGCSKSNKFDERVFGEWVEDTTLLENKPKVLTFMKDGTYTAFYPSKAEGYPDINDKGTFSVKEMPKPEKCILQVSIQLLFLLCRQERKLICRLRHMVLSVQLFLAIQ